ncbi:hypothetical protein ACT3CD_08180 [Geofilum sp. OHC36d9]
MAHNPLTKRLRSEELQRKARPDEGGTRPIAVFEGRLVAVVFYGGLRAY